MIPNSKIVVAQVKSMTLRGARIIFNPTYGSRGALNLCMMRARACESKLPIAFTHLQQALITGPEGEVILNDENPGHRFTVTQVDLSAGDVGRSSESGHLKHR